MVASPEDRQRIERLMRVADVLARMARLVEPVLPRQVQPAVALGATLADDVMVATERPAAPLALIDGWAVRAETTTDGSAYTPAALAGAQPIDVGEAMPPGSDAVVPTDAVVVRAGVAEALASVAPATACWRRAPTPAIARSCAGPADACGRATSLPCGRSVSAAPGCAGRGS